MTSRPYTAVLVDGKVSRVINIIAPLEKTTAYTAVQNMFPEESIIALIPGTHANHSYAYEVKESYKDSDIDLFDTSYLKNNNV